MRVRRVIPPVLVALAATVLLTACPGPVPNPTPTPAPTGTATGTSTPGPNPSLPAEVAFVVTGTLVSPSGGTTVDFTMTVEAPTQADAAADAAAFASSVHCPPDILVDTPPAISNPSYLHIAVETQVSGAALSGEAAPTFGYPLPATTWDGDYVTAQAYCSPPGLTPVPGTATGIGLVEDGVTSGPGGWIPDYGGYGVGVWDISNPYTVTACAIEFGPASVGTPAAGFIQVDATTGCSFGLTNSP